MECQSTGLAGECAVGKGADSALTALPGFSLLSLTSVTGILLLILCPPLHAASRQIFRPTVVFHVERGLSWVELAQRKQMPLLTTLCSFSCLTVSIPFYITFLPLLIWAGKLQLGIRLIILMSFCEFVGNGVKDLICAPRPMGHPRGAGKTKLLLSEKRAGADDAHVHSLEYGLPSSHVMHTLCLNFYVAHYVVSRDLVPQQYAGAIYVMAALWVAWIGFCRVYMGMHTPIDILGGAVIAIMVLSSYLTIDDRYESWMMHDRLAFWKQLILSALLLKLHPLPMQFTPSYQNSVIFAGVALGTLAGVRFSHHQEDYPGKPETGALMSVWGAASLLIRLILGGVLAEGSKEVMKVLAGKALKPVYSAAPVAFRRIWRPPIYSLQGKNPLSKRGVPVDQNGVPWDIYTTTRFISYGCLAWMVTGGSFRLFWLIESRLVLWQTQG